jgi:hypothetical protein
MDDFYYNPFPRYLILYYLAWILGFTAIGLLAWGIIRELI